MRLSHAFRPDRPAIPHRAQFVCGLIAVLGAVLAVAGDIITVRLNDQINFIANTVSEGAAGPHSIWVDLGLSAEAAGLAAIGWGLYSWRGEGLRFKAGCAALGLTALIILAIAWHNAYGDGEPSAFVIHEPLTLVMGLLFAAALGLLAKDLGEMDTGYFRFSFIAGGAWILVWPAFVISPEAWNGAVERVAGFTLVVWMVIAGRLLMRRGRGERLDRGGL